MSVYLQMNEIRPIFITLHKNQLQVDRDLSMEPDAAEGNTGRTLQDICVGKNFMCRALFGQELSPTVDKWYLTKLAGFYTSKET